MANKLKVWDVEDDTGKTYQVEGPVDATPDELFDAVEQLYFSNTNTNTEQAPVVPQPTSSGPKGLSGVQSQPQTQPQPQPQTKPRGIQDSAQFETTVQNTLDTSVPEWLTQEERADIGKLMDNPDISYADINKTVGDLAVSKGLVRVGLGGSEEDLAAYRNSIAGGADSQIPGYTAWANSLGPVAASVPELVDPEADWDEKLVNFVSRGYNEALQEGTAGWAARTYHDWVGTGMDTLRQRFPEATDDQLEAIQENIINTVQKKLREANMIETENDPLIPWLAGTVAGSAGIEDFVPIGIAGKGLKAAAKRVGSAAAVNSGADFLYQGVDIAQGVQDEFRVEQALLAPVIGGLFQGGLEIGSAAGRAVSRTKGGAAKPSNSLPIEDSKVSYPTSRKNSKAYVKELYKSGVEIVEHIDSLTKTWQNSPEIEVNTNFKHMKDVDQDALGMTTPDGRIHLNTENILLEAKAKKVSPEDIVSSVTYHEGLGHYGLAQKFGDSLEGMLDDFYANGSSTFKNQVDDWLKANPKAYEDAPNRHVYATEEVLAEMSEAGRIPASMFDRLTNLVKDFAREMGIELRFSEREIKTILGMAHNAVVSGKGRDVSSNGYRYMMTGVRGSQNKTGSDLAPDELYDVYDRVETALEGVTDTAARQKIMQEMVGPDSQIRKDTGWFMGPDRRWRMEIDDSNAGYNLERPLHRSSTLGDVLDHPALFDLYPELNDVIVTREKGMFKNDLGSYDPKTNTININPNASNPKAVLLHEVQHKVQDIEGFSQGGSPRSALNRVSPARLTKIAKKVKSYYAREAKKYETEAAAFKTAANDPLFQEYTDAYKEWSDNFHNPDVPKDSLQYAESGRRIEEIKRKLASKYLGEEDLKSPNISSKDRDDFQALLFNARPKQGTKTSNLLQASEDAHYEGRINRRLSKQVEASLDDVGKLRAVLSTDQHLPFQAYEHLFGEVEARDTANRMRFTEQERQNTVPFTSESHINPDDYIFDRGMGPKEQLNRYMKRRTRDVSEEEQVRNASEILKGVLDDYEPTYRSWDEAKREARLRGLTAKQIRKAKGIGDLDKRLFQYDAVADVTDSKLVALHEKMNDGTFTINDKASYLETVFSYNELMARIFSDQAEVGRALNAMKALNFTKRKMTELNEILREYQGNNISAFADDKIFLEFADRIKYLLDTDDRAGAHVNLTTVTKPYWWQYILTFRHAAMLSGLGTQAKNAADNAIMITRELEEAIVALPGGLVRSGLRKAGKNVKEGVSAQEVVARVYGLTRSLFDADTYKNTLSALKEGHGNSRYSSKIEIQDAHIPGISKIQDVLHASDTFFRAFHQNTNLYALGVRKAREEGFRGIQAFTEGTNLAATASKDMIDEAKRFTDTALLVDSPSGLTSWLEAGKAIKPGADMGEQLQSFLINFMVPFLRVTDRLIHQKLRRVPVLGLLDKNTRADLAAGGPRMDIALGRMAYGGALLWLYWEKAGEGQVTGSGPGDYEKKQALEAGGYMSEAVKEDGQYTDASALNLSLNPVGYQNATAAHVASIRDAYENGKADDESTAKGLAYALLATMKEISSVSFAESLKPYADVMYAEEEFETDAAIASAAGGAISQFVPAAMRQYNQLYHDTIKRDTTGDKSIPDRIYGRVASAIPGLSDDLPAKYDLYGDQVNQGRTLSSIENFQPIKDDEVSVELQRLERTTDDAVVKGAPSSFQHEGERIKLTADGKQEWQRVQGFYLRQGMSDVIRSDEWKQASDEDKILIVKEIRTEAYELTKEYMLPLLGVVSNEEEL